MSILSDISTTEKNLWGELIVDLVVALYYFPKIFWIIRAGDTALIPMMAGLVFRTIIVAIIVGIAVFILLRVWREPRREDERDLQFSARGTIIANRALVVLIAMIMGQLAFEGLFPGLRGQFGIITKPLIVAHLLLLSLLLSSTIKAVAQLLFYRRNS